MSVKAHTWVSLWFLVTIPVILWDASYLFMRPRSMKGGDLHWIWEPYGIYQEIDYVYGVKSFENGDGFPNAQAFMNIIETLLNAGYLYLTHVSLWSPAPLVGFAAALMTLSKTVLYWALEYFCGGCSTGHTSMKEFIIYWIIPNGLWIVVPSLIIFRLGKDLVTSLLTADKKSAGKTQ